VQPSVIFIDEVDSLLPKRDRAHGLRSLTNELLAFIDGIQTGSEARVIIIAATNFPWDLDEAALSRCCAVLSCCAVLCCDVLCC
jgi:SpoVK/Ycf46/Vps4 family AAA+-type ATPase